MPRTLQRSINQLTSVIQFQVQCVVHDEELEESRIAIMNLKTLYTREQYECIHAFEITKEVTSLSLPELFFYADSVYRVLVKFDLNGSYGMRSTPTIQRLP